MQNQEIKPVALRYFGMNKDTGELSYLGAFFSHDHLEQTGGAGAGLLLLEPEVRTMIRRIEENPDARFTYNVQAGKVGIYDEAESGDFHHDLDNNQLKQWWAVYEHALKD